VNLLDLFNHRITQFAIKTHSSSFAVLNQEIAIEASGKSPIFPLGAVFTSTLVI
jgi:hypothetical protein